MKRLASNKESALTKQQAKCLYDRRGNKRQSLRAQLNEQGASVNGVVAK